VHQKLIEHQQRIGIQRKKHRYQIVPYWSIDINIITNWIEEWAT